MRGRTPVLLASLGLVALLAGLTVKDMIDNGFNFLIAVSFLIVLVLGSGVIGALTTPPPEE